MKLDLIIPGLLWQDVGDIDYIYSTINTKNCDYLVKRASQSQVEFSYSDFFYGLLFPKATNLPLTFADYLATKHGLKHKHDYFMLIEPTHLRVDRDRLLICEPQLLQLSLAEQELVINDLNQHFANQLALYYITDNLWLIGHSDPQLNNNLSMPLIDIIGENIDNFLPQGDNSISYTNLLNEIQMVLHNHPLNKQRKPKLAINSLWAWNKSIKLPPELHFNDFNRKIYTTNERLLSSGNNNINSLDTEFALNAITNNSIILLDSLYYAKCYRDSSKYIDLLEQIEKTIGLTLATNLYTKLDNLTLYIPNFDKTIKLSATRFDWLKLWKNNSLIKIVKGYN
jgi:hypothetical protein